MSEKPLAIDLFCGLGGWTEGLLAEGYRVVGFDNERHIYGDHEYPGELVVQDVLTLHGSQFADAALIVASPPCQEYSYMAMPWSRAKQIARALRGKGEFPEGYTGSRTGAELNALFDACFRIQREASHAAGRHIPMVVENVRGAQDWVGRARWHHGSYYLWGDVPALMPIVRRQSWKACESFSPVEGTKVGGFSWSDYGKDGYKPQGFNVTAAQRATKNSGGSWFSIAHNTTSGKGRNPDGRNDPRDGIKIGGDWFNDLTPIRRSRKRSTKRKVASALIAKIPLVLARHVAAVYRPRVSA